MSSLHPVVFSSAVTLMLSTGLLLQSGCASREGAYMSTDPSRNIQEVSSKFVLMDPGARRSIKLAGPIQQGTTQDGRLQVSANVMNRENRRLQVQVQCVFKNANGVSTGDETPWSNLILTENGIETVSFTALNNEATDFTIRVREAR
jgi:uncharacterized protein YcfL